MFQRLIKIYCLLCAATLFSQAPVITGTQEVWHKITLTYTSVESFTEATTVTGDRPFLDRRLIVTFTGPSAQVYEVPGYFAADGNAAETSASSGTKWRVHFAPDEAGTWSYNTSFRSGTAIAVEFPVNPATGTAVEFNGEASTFSVSASSAPTTSLRYKGRVGYDGTRYLKHADGDLFLKVGPDSPETFLCYEDFDNTISGRNDPGLTEKVKTYEPHAADWESGDPVWQTTKGTEIIGLVNYLAAQGMNSISFLTFSVNGDGDNVWPQESTAQSFLDTAGTDAQNQSKFDCSKLDQWGIVFDHATDKDMFLHFKTQETENDGLLQGLSIQRKAYYRELIARFGHNLALNWNVGEENTNTTAQQIDFAAYIAATDPYDHHIVIHTYPEQWDDVYPPLYGTGNAYTGASLQAFYVTPQLFSTEIASILAGSLAAGKQWAVAWDEQGLSNLGVGADTGYTAYLGAGTAGDNRTQVRNHALWGTFLTGGWGVEYYYGYETGTTDLTAEDHRSRAAKWPDAKIALDFLRTKELWTLTPDPTIVSGTNYAMRNDGVEYLVYLVSGGTQTLTTAGTGDYNVYWFDPRNGGALTQTATATITAGSAQSLGAPPNNTTSDWVVVATKATEPVNKRAVGNSVGGGRISFGNNGNRIQLILTTEE